MKKDLLLSMAVFCLTLIASFAMDDDLDDPAGKNLGIEKTKYETSEKAGVHHNTTEP